MNLDICDFQQIQLFKLCSIRKNYERKTYFKKFIQIQYHMSFARAQIRKYTNLISITILRLRVVGYDKKVIQIKDLRQKE